MQHNYYTHADFVFVLESLFNGCDYLLSACINVVVMKENVINCKHTKVLQSGINHFLYFWLKGSISCEVSGLKCPI